MCMSAVRVSQRMTGHDYFEQTINRYSNQSSRLVICYDNRYPTAISTMNPELLRHNYVHVALDRVFSNASSRVHVLAFKTYM